MTQEKILERVRKLLALANDERATEGERDNALRMAHKTLALHNLDMEALDKFEREKLDPREHLDTEGWDLPWCRDLRDCISALFFCKYYFGRRINATRGRHTYVGRASNVATAAYMCDWIIASVLKEADKLHGHRLTRAGRSFCMGVVDRLRDRVREIIANTQQDIEATGSGLVLADYYRTEKESNALYASTQWGEIAVHKSRASGTVDMDAYKDGERFGNKVNLSKQLGPQENQKLLK